MGCPSLRINSGKICSKRFEVRFFDVMEGIIFVGEDSLRFGYDRAGQTGKNLAAKGVLLEKCFIACSKKKCLIVGRVVVAGIVGHALAIYQKAPPSVALPKIYGAVYGIEALGCEPGFSMIAKKIGSRLTINTLEEPNASDF